MEDKLRTIMQQDCLAVKCESGVLKTTMPLSAGEGRAEKVDWLVRKAFSQTPDIKNFPWVVFSYADKPLSLDRCLEIQKSVPYYQPCTSDLTDYTYTYPDYFFKDCYNYGISDYEEYRVRVMSAGIKRPTTQALGWLGAPTSPVRNKFIDIARSVGQSKIFYRNINWDSDYKTIPPEKYMSVIGQTGMFKYLIDMEGLGYSPRLKLQFFSYRPVFIVDRPWCEFFYKDLEPWEHYIPVSRDLSDLLENLERVERDTDLYKRIVSNASDFAQAHLTQDKAVAVYKGILQRHAN